MLVETSALLFQRPVTIGGFGSCDQTNAFEKSLISKELTRRRGNVVKISERLGFRRKTLYDRSLKQSLYRDNLFLISYRKPC